MAEDLLALYTEESRLEGLVAPRYDGYSIVEVAGTVYSSLGLNFKDRQSRVLDRDALSGTSKVVFIVVDGLGYYQLKRVGGKALSKLLDMGVDLLPITTVAPTTTATALASLASASYPGEHGLMGYVLWIKEVGAVVKTLAMRPAIGGPRDQLRDSGWRVSDLFRITTPFAKLWLEGVAVKAYVPVGVKESEYTKLIYTGADIHEVVGLGELSVKLARELGGEGPFLAMAYIPNLDSVLHADSPESEEYAAELWHVLKALTRIFEAAKSCGDAAVIVVSDHGGISVYENDVLWLNEVEELLDALYIPPTGESRMSYIYTRQVDRVKELLESQGLFVIETEDAAKRGLFGPNLLYRHRAGDLIALPRDSTCLRYPYGSRDTEFDLRGHHGGLTPPETIVPLMFYLGRA